MKPNARHGRLFEIGPDGYGYLLDEDAPGRSYMFHTSMLKGLNDVIDLENAEVKFILVNERPEEIAIIRPKAKARGVG